jgi:hypothetical protein
LSSPNLARSICKIEDLPSDNGRTVDTIAGALFRIFLRLEQFDTAMGQLGRRLAALEGPQRPSAKVDASKEASTPAETSVPIPASVPATSEKRGRGRPPGSKNKPKSDGFATAP